MGLIPQELTDALQLLETSLERQALALERLADSQDALVAIHREAADKGLYPVIRYVPREEDQDQ